MNNTNLLGTKKHALRYEVTLPLNMTVSDKNSFRQTISTLIEESWGHFPDIFIEKHILSCEKIALVYVGNRVVGFCAATRKKISRHRVHYVEFTAVLPSYQGSGVGVKLTLLAIKSMLIGHMVKRFYAPFELMFITPNIRVVATLARYATYIYPNPYLADPITHRIAPANDTTWAMAQELIRISEDPHRRIEREGLVLHGSYRHSPWQILDGDAIPWHRNESLNNFAQKYIGYGRAEDKEFIVHAKIGILSLFRYLKSSLLR